MLQLVPVKLVELIFSHFSFSDLFFLFFNLALFFSLVLYFISVPFLLFSSFFLLCFSLYLFLFCFVFLSFLFILHILFFSFFLFFSFLFNYIIACCEIQFITYDYVNFYFLIMNGHHPVFSFLNYFNCI